MAIGTPTSLGNATSSTNADTVTLTGVTASVGDLIVAVAERHFYDEGTTFADSAGNTWQVDADLAHTGSTGGYAIGSTVVTSALSSGTITATFAGGPFAFGRGIYAFKVTGIASATWRDQTVEAQHAGGANTSVSVGPSGTLTQADELAVGVATGFDSATFTPGGGWTELADFALPTGSINLQVAYQIVSATTALTYTATASAATTWAAGLVTYKGGSSGVDQTVTSPVADAVGDLVTPSVSGDANATVTSPPMDALGSIPVTGMVISVEVIAPPMAAIGNAPDPTVTGSSAGNVTAPVADALGDIPTPAVEAGSEAVSPAADALGDVPAPAVLAGSTVTSPPLDAAGDLLAPVTVGEPSERLRFGVQNTGGTLASSRTITGGNEPAHHTGGEALTNVTGGAEVVLV